MSVNPIEVCFLSKTCHCFFIILANARREPSGKQITNSGSAKDNKNKAQSNENTKKIENIKKIKHNAFYKTLYLFIFFYRFIYAYIVFEYSSDV